MSKRIVICADGTWNRPEKDLKEDIPTNVLRLARAIKPVGSDQIPQQVFYDWGIGSYHDKVTAGATGKGLDKNIMDDYRYIVQNYSPGDDIYLFGFSRGAYTVRALCGLINNCGIIKRPDARLIQRAFNHYKKPGAAHAPQGSESIKFRKEHSHKSREIKFVGVWDTVGAMGIPIRFLGFLEEKDEFYDTKIGKNVRVARHALAIDEHRSDFEPTIWVHRENMDIQQVWFAGAHCDIGGSYKPDKDGSFSSDIALGWMIREAGKSGLAVETHLKQNLTANPLSAIHKSRRLFYKLKTKFNRSIEHKPDSNKVKPANLLIHESVKLRWDKDPKYRPDNLKEYIKTNGGWPNKLVK
jgi:uncharacterized protein (DUF2235 family)